MALQRSPSLFYTRQNKVFLYFLNKQQEILKTQPTKSHYLKTNNEGTSSGIIIRNFHTKIYQKVYLKKEKYHVENGNFSTIQTRGLQKLSTNACPAASSAVAKDAENDEEASSPPKEFSEIPGPKPWPIVKNTLQIYFRKDFDIEQMQLMWKNLFAEYDSPIIKMDFLGMPTIVATLNPDDLETFLQATMHNPIRQGFTSLKMIRDNEPSNYFNKKAGLLPENGDEWWRLRSRVQGPLLRPRNVAHYLPKVDAATVTFMRRIDVIQEQHGGKVPENFLNELYKWALECVGLVALNKELGCLEDNLSEDSVPMRLIQCVNDMFSALNKTEMGLQTWRLYRSPAYVQLETAHKTFLEIASKSIQEAADALEAVAAERGGENTDRTLTIMETFLNTDGLSKSDVATMILDMLLAGVDTTSHSVAFTLYLLARNPECQRILQEEVDRVLGDEDSIQPHHIVEMTYLNHVLKESLRLFPLTMGNARVLTEDVVMSGYKVPTGTVIFGLNVLISKDEKYFKRASEFLPSRWDRDRPHGPIHPYASLPFSHGKRMCIGKRIAEQEIYTLIIRAMQKYTVSLEGEQEMEVKTQLVFKPNILLPFSFKLRK